MVYDFSKNDKIATAIEKAFDGKHPCEVCLRLMRIKNTLPQLKANNLANKNLFLYDGADPVLVFKKPVQLLFYSTKNINFNSIDLSPRTPPPRRA